MLRANLATRPFYNERLVSLAIITVAMAAALLTAFNATRIVTLSQERGEARAHVAADREETSRVAAHATALQRGIDRALLVQLAESAHEANELIGTRTFSWTLLFARLEKTLPLDVRLVSVSPRLDADVLKVSATVIARNLDDVSAFVAALSDTGVFYDVTPTSQQINENGTYTAVVDTSYLATRPAAPAGASAQPQAGREGGRP